MTTAAEKFLSITPLQASAAEVYRWHDRPGAFERLTPPFEQACVIRRDGGGLVDGARVELRIGLGPGHLTWIAEHRDCRPGEGFRDVQVKGPFALWEHEHRMLADGMGGSRLEDEIHYRLPFGPFGAVFGEPLVRERLRAIFGWRRRTLAADILAHAPCRSAVRPARVALTGASGLIGGTLVPFLTTGDHDVLRLVRHAPAAADEVHWDPVSGQVGRLDDIDAVVHLAGQGIASGRWTARQKASIRASRVAGTALLARELARLEKPPKVLVCASAIGWYGPRGDEALDEDSESGIGFLAEVGREWEDAARPAVEAGIRVVHLRFGIVLSPEGGALAKMLLPFRLGLGGPVGSGRQWLSWVAIDDVIDAIHAAIVDERLVGAVNVTAPQPVRQGDFARALGRVLGRPAFLPLPALAPRLALGSEMADALLLTGARVLPKRLQAGGFTFRHPTLDDALAHVLGIPTDATQV